MTPARRPHALVVGGTGMLREAALGLVERGHAVSVVARNARRLEALRIKAKVMGGILRPVCVDYRDADALAFGIGEAVAELGPARLAVVWAHSSAPHAPFVVAERLAKAGGPTDFFHVLGSAAADPSQPDARRSEGFSKFDGVAYHEIVLGFVLEPGGSRWLTDDEIAAGVLRAIDLRAPRTIVGIVEPWTARP